MRTLDTMTTTAEHGFIPVWTAADRLRKVRRTLRVTQRQMADVLDVTESAYEAWEAGRNQPSNMGQIARRLEDRYGVPAWWMLGRSPAPGSGRRVSDTELMHTREPIAA